MTGKTAVGRRGWRLGKQKDGGGDGKQSGEVCVEAGEAGGAAAAEGAAPSPPPLRQVPAQDCVLTCKTPNTSSKFFIYKVQNDKP